MRKVQRMLSKLGAGCINKLWRLGAGARLFWLTLISSGESFRRFRLTVREIYFTGVLSLIIILVSAFFVGMVLALQGYHTLQKYGSSEAIGVLVALALVRELGPVVTALLFAGRAGTAITAEIGLMKATEQLSAMEMMAVSPIARVVAPRFCDCHAYPGNIVYHGWYSGWLSGGCPLDRGGCRGFLVANAGQCGLAI